MFAKLRISKIETKGEEVKEKKGDRETETERHIYIYIEREKTIAIER